MTVKRLFDLPIGPGLYTEQSERGARGRWHRADKVRFRKGLAEKIGGWEALSPTFLGVCRRLHDWSSLDSKRWIAIGTDAKLYLWQDGTLHDITPLRDSGILSNPFDTTISSATVTVNDVAHGGQVGDYVRFANADPVGGITIDGEYQIQSVPNSDSYTILHSAQATSTVSGGGGSVNYEYDISAGGTTASTATGYGTGPYGREGYGNARTGSTLILNIRTWALDNWGEDLLASPSGGAIYHWDRSLGTGQRAVALGGDAPHINQYMIISTRNRHVIALGAYDSFNDRIDPLLIRWSSSENLNDWTPTSTNTSGDLRIYSGSKIVTAVRSRLEVVIFTDVSVHTMPFLGGAGSNVFGLNIAGQNVSILGPNCAVPVDVRVFFMAEADFYLYDGVLRVLPCDVRNFVFDNLNYDQTDKIYGGLNREFNEIWWFYPSYDTDAWVQADSSLRVPVGFQTARVSAGATRGYSYIFNSSGFTTISSTAANGYEHDLTLTNDEPLLTPTQAEYAVEFAFDQNTSGTRWVGLTFLQTDITGTIDTTADDAQALYVECDFTTDTIRVRRKDDAGVKSVMDNDPGITSFTAVLGEAPATERKYILTAQVSDEAVTVFVDGSQALTFALSAAEQALYTGGTFGFHAEANIDNNGEVKFYNVAAGPLNVLTAADFDISPIEVNRYVAFNYEEGTWTTGKLSRTAWHDRSPTLNKPFAADVNGVLYRHETGTDDDGTAMTAFIESFDMEIPDAGEFIMHVDQLIPDFLTLEGSVDVTLNGRKYPQAPLITKGPYPVTATTHKISTRMRARQISLRVESDQRGDKWRMGFWRGRAGAHGKRT